MNCPGHKCRLAKLYVRPSGQGYEPLDDLLFCRECVDRKCSCLGIHVASGMSISFLALGELTTEGLRIPGETPIRVTK